MEKGKSFVFAFLVFIIGMIVLSVSGVKDAVLAYWVGVIFAGAAYAVVRWVVPKVFPDKK